MSNRNIQCDDSRLNILLNGDEDSDQFRLVAEHLESCPHCCNRLTVLASDRETWDDVSNLLRGYEGTGDFSVRNSESSLAPRLDLSFLSPPSHPEMLGRLGRYEIERVIGSGGMGVVLKAHDTELNRPVAVKVLASYLAHSGAARQRFAREGRAAAAVVHEHVVAIHNVETQADMPYLVMQYVQGQSLQTRVDQHGPLSVKEILRIAIQSADGLSAAHAQGVVHRDVKPSNIMLENDVERALLTDFGLARAADDATVTRSGVITGTPHYMSPEQASVGIVDERSDLFSLGALLYFMATGHPPFRAERALAVLNRICNDHHRPVWEVNPDIPDELSAIIDRLLQKKPQKRFANAAQTREVLLRLLEKLQQPGGVSRRRSGIHRWFRSRRRQFVIGTAGIAATAIFFSGVFDSSPSAQTASTDTNVPETPETSDVEGAVSNLRIADTNPTNAFTAELTDVRHNLQTIEATSSGNTDLNSFVGATSWNREVEALKHRLSEIEESLLNNTHPPREE